MLEQLKERVLKQNLELKNSGLVVLTWGNASAIDKESGLIVIKPSGVPYEALTASDMVVVDSKTGKVVEGNLSPSSDLATHLYLYQNFKDIQGVVHTHSTYSVAWAQGGKDIPVYGTTHADVFYGSVPCTRALTKEEVDGDYELNTGKVIVERFKELDYNAMPGVVVKNHGPFTWGNSIEKAVENAITLEEVAKMALFTIQINNNAEPVKQYLLDKHYLRKHGKNAYYGQIKKDK